MGRKEKWVFQKRRMRKRKLELIHTWNVGKDAPRTLSNVEKKEVGFLRIGYINQRPNIRGKRKNRNSESLKGHKMGFGGGIASGEKGGMDQRSAGGTLIQQEEKGALCLV